MGKLIKNHWARLIILAAAAYQFAAAIEGFFWPKILWDVFTKNLNSLVKPFPILQILNLLFALIMLALEWPIKPLAKHFPGIHRSFELRLVAIPGIALSALLLYQGTNAGIYYLIGTGVYFWAFIEGETICAEPWTLPKKPSKGMA